MVGRMNADRGNPWICIFSTQLFQSDELSMSTSILLAWQNMTTFWADRQKTIVVGSIRFPGCGGLYHLFSITRVQTKSGGWELPEVHWSEFSVVKLVLRQFGFDVFPNPPDLPLISLTDDAGVKPTHRQSA